MARSVATITAPEFINVKPFNPLISQCDIKVLYVGENRNRSFISKQVAIEMANSLPGCPIVGYFKEDKGDFSDHGQVMTIDGDGVKFEVKTKPYGFIAPDARIWFKEFVDTDEFGNETTREYLMTNGYLWTGQYAEVQGVLAGENNQSMELDENSLDGKWATNNNTGVEFFIINDAIFSKLAILGKDVEPCFEGANITAPEISSSYSLDDEFKTTLFSMMHDLQSAIESREGGLKNMTEKVFKKLADMSPEEVDALTPEEKKELEDKEAAAEASLAEEEAAVAAQHALAEQEAAAAAFVAEEAAAEYALVEAARLAAEQVSVEEKFALLEASFAELQTKFAALETETIGLREFKLENENEKKQTLIKSFYMLSDEDKADVVENMSKYSLEDIEAKLAVVCLRKKVSFEAAPEEDTEEARKAAEAALLFNLEETADLAPAFVQVLRDVKVSN